MHTLAFQIRATVVGVLALFAALVAFVWWLGPGMREERRMADALAQTAAELLPSPDRPVTELQAAVDRLGRRFGVDVGVYAADGRRLAAFGSPKEPGGKHGHWVKVRGDGLSATLHLPDGRVVVGGRRRDEARHVIGFVTTLTLLGLAVAIGAWPVAGRLTRRLSHLRRRVEDLGTGDLAARAPVEGRDEVAALARSFNRAADRIQGLVEAERRRLAFASHELRSPLARLRLSLEVLSGDPEVKKRAESDVAELDGLIAGLLEAGRLQSVGRGPVEDVDLLALAAEEAARVAQEAEGDPVSVDGDPALLRRLVRNLIENACRHGRPPIAVHVRRMPGGGGRLEVADRGPGVPEGERERVFEPFHRPAGSAETGLGYGLGLALVRQIARAHGGEVRCLPREGGGSLFRVDLPGRARA